MYEVEVVGSSGEGIRNRVGRPRDVLDGVGEVAKELLPSCLTLVEFLLSLEVLK